MKWGIAAFLILIGLGSWEKSWFVGLLFLAGGAGIIWYSVASHVSASAPPPRPTAAISAKSEARDEVARAERKARKHVKKVEKAATETGQQAVAAARARIEAEPRWV